MIGPLGTLRQLMLLSRDGEKSMHPLQTRQEGKPHGSLILAAISAASILTACVAVPLPRLDPPRITDEQLVPIEMGKTTLAELEAVLGEPNIVWETERIWVYEEGPSGHILWVLPYGWAVMDAGEDVVIMRFDEEGRIERLDRRTGPLFRENYGDFLRAWLAEQGDETGSNSKP